MSLKRLSWLWITISHSAASDSLSGSSPKYDLLSTKICFNSSMSELISFCSVIHSGVNPLSRRILLILCCVKSTYGFWLWALDRGLPLPCKLLKSPFDMDSWIKSSTTRSNPYFVLMAWFLMDAPGCISAASVALSLSVRYSKTWNQENEFLFSTIRRAFILCCMLLTLETVGIAFLVELVNRFRSRHNSKIVDVVALCAERENKW